MSHTSSSENTPESQGSRFETSTTNPAIPSAYEFASAPSPVTQLLMESSATLPTGSPSGPIESELQRARSELARVKEAQELRLIQAEIRFRADPANDGKRFRTADDDDETTSKRARYEYTTRRDTMENSIHKFDGQKHSDWKRTLNELIMRFNANKSNYRDDARKIVLASSHLEGMAYTRWIEGFVTSVKTWEQFVQFGESFFAKGLSRDLETWGQLQGLRQQANQTTAEFYLQWNALHSELPNPVETKTRIPMFLACLNSEAKKMLVTRGVAGDWTELYSSLVGIDNLIQGPKETSRGQRQNPREGTPRKGPENEGSSTPAPTLRERRDSAACYKCGEIGHLRPSCTKPDCNICKSALHTTSLHPKGRVSGIYANPNRIELPANPLRSAQ
jgi:hypothetical protein